MHYILASDPISWLAPWGQASAIVLLLYMLILILIGLGLTLGLMLGLSWVRQKAELIKKLRPTVDSVNVTTEEAIKGTLPVSINDENKIVRTVAEVPARMQDVEHKIDDVNDRVASAVIEFRARTVMVQGIVKAFFLPGLKKKPRTVLEEEGVGFRSPGYRMLVEEHAPEDMPTEPGDGFAGTISSSQIKGAPVQVPVSSPYKDEAH